MRKLLLLAAVLLSTATLAHAGTCRDVVIFDTVYGNSTPTGKYEYTFQIRNKTKHLVYTDVSIGTIKDTATFSRTVRGIALAADQTKSIKFAIGTNTQVNNGSVKFLYDTVAPDNALAASNCTAK